LEARRAECFRFPSNLVPPIIRRVSVTQPPEPSNAIFPTTHWTTLLVPIAERTDAAHAALEELMQVYREPIVRFVATQIQDKQKAPDIAHDFIERMLERGDLAKADRTKGRFRSFQTLSKTCMRPKKP
jgi:hypothetical protein